MTRPCVTLLDRLASGEPVDPSFCVPASEDERDEAAIECLAKIDGLGSRVSASQHLVEARRLLPSDHPIVQTLEFVDGAESEADWRARSAPAFVHAWDHIGHEADAFARCVLEHHRSHSRAVFQCRTFLGHLPDLDALAMAYEFESCYPGSNTTRPLAAMFHHVLGVCDWREPEHVGPRRLEILATLAEIDADRSLLKHCFGCSERTLDWCRPWLDACPIRGRRATLHVMSAVQLAAGHRFDDAVQALEMAELELPDGIDHRHRFFIIHLQALYRFKAGHFDEALHHLDRSVPLQHACGGPRWLAQHLVLRGQIAEKRGHLADAVSYLHDALLEQCLAMISGSELRATATLLEQFRSRLRSTKDLATQPN